MGAISASGEQSLITITRPSDSPLQRNTDSMQARVPVTSAYTGMTMSALRLNISPQPFAQLHQPAQRCARGRVQKAKVAFQHRVGGIRHFVSQRGFSSAMAHVRADVVVSGRMAEPQSVRCFPLFG